MCFFKKKKKEKFFNAKFPIGTQVRFRYHDELTFGWVYNVKKIADDKLIYDIQIGGQCPSIIENIEEDRLKVYVK